MKQRFFIIMISSMFLFPLSLHAKAGPELRFAAQNRWDEVLNLLDRGGDVRQIDAQGRTLLMYCAQYNYPNVLRKLIALGSEVNRKDKNGRDALVYAVKKGQYEQAYYLIKAGAQLQHRPRHGGDLLGFALAWNDHDTALTLIACGAIPNRNDYPRLPKLLIEAAERPLTQAAIALLAYTIDVNRHDENFKTPLMHAAQKGSLVLTQGLIAAGAKVDEVDHKGRTALSFALAGRGQKTELRLRDPLQELFNEQDKADYKGVIGALRSAGARVSQQMMEDMLEQDEKEGSFWKFYIRSQLFYWEIILYYLGVILTLILLYRQFNEVVDKVVIAVAVVVGLITTVGLLGNQFPALQFILTTSKIGNVLFAVLRATVITAFAFSIIYLLWQLLETSTDHYKGVVVEDNTCCPHCGRPITFDNRHKGFCPFCKQRFNDEEDMEPSS